MMRFTLQLIVVVLALAPLGARAQQQDDLDVTMKVVPANASAGSALSEIKLPDAASDRARASSAFGQSTANKAQEMKSDIGRELGQGPSEPARGKNAGKGKGKNQ